jgi:4-amino-4-deoxy-L-arabinose transferase-like glycosyltransferase
MVEPQTRNLWQHRAEIAALVGVLLLAALLRLVNVGENPAWYTDEAIHIDIARHLANGEIRTLAVQESTLLFARPPLFHLLLAILLRVAPGADAMLLLRTLTGTLGVLAVLLVYVLGRVHGQYRLGLLAATALALLPQAVLYSRFGFSYNLLAVLSLVAALGLTRYVVTGRMRWLLLAGLSLGLGTLTDIAGFALLPPFAVALALMRRPRALLRNLPLLLAPFAIYMFLMLLHAPDAFLFDLRYTLARTMQGGDLTTQFATLSGNARALLTESPWLLLGVVGLVLLRPARLRWGVLLLFWLPLVAIGRGVALYSLSAYYLIPFLPLLALGIAALLDAAARFTAAALDRLSHRGARSLLTNVVAWLFAVLLLLPPALAGLQALQSGFPTPIDRFLIDTRAARAVAAYVNAQATPQDIVITSPALSWLLDTQTADFQMTIAAQGHATPHLPSDIAPLRWAFPMSPDSARFVVIDNLWHNWGLVHIPQLHALIEEVERWPLVYTAGELRVYANPESSPLSEVP